MNTDNRTIGDLIDVTRAPAVISLTNLEEVRDQLCAGDDVWANLSLLLGQYYLGDPETRAAFETMLRSLGRAEARGDAFNVAGVYGSGKSHLLAALCLLCGHPKEAWPAFLESHPEFETAADGLAGTRLVVTIALDEYPTQSHPLEHVVFSRLERELASRHGISVALTEDSYLLQLVQEYVLPRCEADLRRLAREAGQPEWQTFAQQRPEEAARAALAFLRRTGFPLDWRRSRAEAWAALRAVLGQEKLDGPLILLDELGVFLAGKDRKGLNTDASFLQYLAQLTAGERCWLVCATQRGLEEVGDIDRRTVRQMRDRFRATFILDLAKLGWVVEHKLVRKLHPESFPDQVAGVYAQYQHTGAEIGFSGHELAHAYPLSPLCLGALQCAAERCLSPTRSVVRLLQEAVFEREWLSLPASRLITPDAAFDLLLPEMVYSPEGRAAVSVIESVLANAAGLASHREAELAIVVKALGLLALGDLKWPIAQLRSSLVGCREAVLWQEAQVLPELLGVLYRRGGYVERTRREGEDADEYYLDVGSTAGEHIRRRLGEVLAELRPDDSRVPRSALETCTDSAFPLTGLLDTRSVSVEWLNTRRRVSVVCRDLRTISADELHNLVAALDSPHIREESALFIALPHQAEEQERSWIETTSYLGSRFSSAVLAWLPRPLRASECDHLLEHAALATMVADPTLTRRRDHEVRDKLRGRWADSAAEVRAALQRTYYEGTVLGVGGRAIIEPERLSTLLGDWEATLTAAFADGFGGIFPRFPAIAPARRLAGRTQTNQIIDQFLRPGEVHLPPASTLEANLLAYAKPLGLLVGEERHFRLALPRRELAEAALDAAPPRRDGEALDPSQVIAFGELAGKLAKSEWGVTREQSELLVAALLRTGYLVALDAFLQPLPFEAVAAPLGDFLPYVMRAAPLTGEAAEKARALWSAVTGEIAHAWDLPAQERAWRDLVAWSRRVLHSVDQSRAALAQAAEAFGHETEAWAEVTTALARAEEAARGVEASHPSREGLLKLVQAVDRLPGGTPSCAKSLSAWREYEQFLARGLQELLSLQRLVCDDRTSCPEGSLLARQRREVLDRFAEPARLVGETAAATSAARGWLETYRRHYLAWHEGAHAASRFAPLVRLRQQAVAETARRMARAGLLTEEATRLEADLSRALGRRCFAGDPLPAGHVVCPLCGLRLGAKVVLPEAQELSPRVEALLAAQLQELQGHRELLTRRLRGCQEEQVRKKAGALLCHPTTTGPEAWAQQAVVLLTEDVVTWIYQQLGQPRAARKRLGDLSATLLGKELPKREVRRAVEEWLGGEEEEMVEVVP